MRGSLIPAAGLVPLSFMRPKLSFLLLSVLPACGGAMPSAAPPAAEPASESAAPSSLRAGTADEAVGELDAAERELDRLLGGSGDATGPGGLKKEGEERPLAGGDGCSIACRALASMRRAADHLCELAGEGDTRCSDARARVGRASDRVRGSCASCE